MVIVNKLLKQIPHIQKTELPKIVRCGRVTNIKNLVIAPTRVSSISIRNRQTSDIDFIFFRFEVIMKTTFFISSTNYY